MDTSLQPSDPFWESEVRRFLPDADEALTAAMEYIACPICQVLSGLPFSYFAMLPKRWPEEPELREHVIRARGFCRPHTWRLAGMQSLVAIAGVFVDVLGEIPSERSATQDPCPVCKLQTLATQRLVTAYRAWLASEEGQDQYPTLFGLCYDHLDRMLETDPEPDVREMLVTSQERRRQELLTNLHGFLDKNTIEGKWTRTVDENRAPRRSLLKLAGSEEA
jgi:hypothetical protein